MLTPAAFLQLFPEFAGQTNALLVAAKLQLAAARMGGPDYTVWGQPSLTPGATPTIADQAQGYLFLFAKLAGLGAGTVQAQTAIGIITAESGGRYSAHNRNIPVEDSIGLAQINLLAPGVKPGGEE